jgi:hypothetical protein
MDVISACISTIYILFITILLITLLSKLLLYLKINSFNRVIEERNPSTTEILILERKKALLNVKLQKSSSSFNIATTSPSTNITSRSQQTIILTLNRGQVLRDTMRCLIPYTGNRLLVHRKIKIKIKFKNEEGIDAGGLTREWFMEISKEVFDPTKLPLFIVSESDRSSLSLNPLYCRPLTLYSITSSFLSYFSFSTSSSSSSNSTAASSSLKPIIKLAPAHLKYYKTFGIIMAKAVYESQLLNIVFSNLFFGFEF